MNKKKLFFIAAAVILLVFSSCDGGYLDPGMEEYYSNGMSDGMGGGGSGGGGMSGGGGGGGTFTVTGIPSKYNGKYAFLAWGTTDSGARVVIGGFKDWMTMTPCPISGGTVRIPVWLAKDGGVSKYSGGDTFLGLPLAITTSANSLDVIGLNVFDTVKFSRGSATVSWSSGLLTDLDD